jgi:Adenylate kinase
MFSLFTTTQLTSRALLISSSACSPLRNTTQLVHRHLRAYHSTLLNAATSGSASTRMFSGQSSRRKDSTEDQAASKMSKNTVRVCFIGAPGGGKGTQASWAVRDFALDHISSGNLLRSEGSHGLLFCVC